jgi:hypothetical protein
MEPGLCVYLYVAGLGYVLLHPDVPYGLGNDGRVIGSTYIYLS